MSQRDLHGSAPDKSAVVLLLIDVINDLDFPEADQMLDDAVRMAERLASLKQSAKQGGVPVVYVNDNFGRWRSDFRALVENCLREGVRGQAVVALLTPDDDDYFVLKPKHSGFYSTTLDILLKRLEAQTLILGGMAANICVLFTANDAYMRDYKLYIPEDCVCSNSGDITRQALEQMNVVLKADITASTEISVQQIIAAAKRDQLPSRAIEIANG